MDVEGSQPAQLRTVDRKPEISKMPSEKTLFFQEFGVEK